MTTPRTPHTAQAQGEWSKEPPVPDYGCYCWFRPNDPHWGDSEVVFIRNDGGRAFVSLCGNELEYSVEEAPHNNGWWLLIAEPEPPTEETDNDQ